MTMQADALPDFPEWRNPSMLMVWIEKEYQCHARIAVVSRCPACTLGSVADDKKQTIYESLFPQVRA